MQSNKFEALKLDEFIKDPIFTDYYHTKKPELKSFEMVMQRYRNEKYLYISDNPKKDFIAPKKLSWYSIRYKNPVGIYKDIANSADFETDDRLEIIDIIKGLI
jgi:putative hydrolase of the HAD superfamily